jgi:hypothetical protein
VSPLCHQLALTPFACVPTDCVVRVGAAKGTGGMMDYPVERVQPVLRAEYVR